MVLQRLHEGSIPSPCPMTIGVKHDGGKPRADLLSGRFVLDVCHVLSLGAAKYSPDNWRHVERWRYMAAAGRHWLAYLSGEKLDKESGLSHLSHLVTNCMFLFEKDLEDAASENAGGSPRP